MKALALLAACALLTACSAAQPYARVDRTGYEVGIRGEWQGVRGEIRRLWRVEDRQDFKAAH